jgi:hypothetical protein
MTLETSLTVYYISRGNTSERNRCVTSENYKIAAVSNRLTCVNMDFHETVMTKTKYRNNLDTEADARLRLSPNVLDLKLTCLSK